MLKRGRVALALAAVAAALAVPAVGSAAANPGASVSLSSSADWISPAEIIVYITASCAPFFNGVENGTGSVGVSVSQATSSSSPGGSGFSSSPLTCDNQNHRVALIVSPGPWQLGTALASAFACGFTCDSQVKQIKITKA
jgi:hypothetical protein